MSLQTSMQVRGSNQGLPVGNGTEPTKRKANEVKSESEEMTFAKSVTLIKKIQNFESHTSGPWQNPRGSVSVFANHNQKVCDTTWSNKSALEAEANARLIAAAPELLAACKAAHAMFCDAMFIWGKDDDKKVGHMTKAIAQAIAKVESSL